MKILVVGESCIDVYQHGSCIRLAPDAPAPVFNPAEKIEKFGMAANVKHHLMNLKSEVHLHTNSNWQEIRKTRLIDKKTNHFFIRIDENDGSYGRSDLRNIDFSKYDAVIVSDYNKGFLTESEIKYIASSHKHTFLDTKKSIGNWCKNVFCIKINKNEFQKAKSNISKELMKKLIITLGPEGALYNNITYPVRNVKISSTSGAGDSFVAALAVRFVESNNMEEAVRFANEYATKVVQE